MQRWVCCITSSEKTEQEEEEEEMTVLSWVMFLYGWGWKERRKLSKNKTFPALLFQSQLIREHFAEGDQRPLPKRS